MAIAFASEGMNIVLSDVNPEKLEESAVALRASGAEVLPVVSDVADMASMTALADAAFSRFGRVNRLCLNAGVVARKPFEELTKADWDKVLGVHLGGVINGVLNFLPRLIEQGASGAPLDSDRHVLIVSSMSGVGRADMRVLNAPYVVAKFASAGFAEVMSPALAPHGIDVSVLCPGMSVADPVTARAAANWSMPSAAFYEGNLLSAEQVAAEVLAGIAERRLHIFPARAGRQEVLGRHAMLMHAFDQAERTSPPIDGVE